MLAVKSIYTRFVTVFKILEGIREIELTADLSGGIGGPDIPPDNM